MGNTVTLTLLVDDARKLRALLDEALQPEPPVVQRVSLMTMIEIFEALSTDEGREFEVVFQKLDGSYREMRAKMVGPVQYNFAKRERYVNVIDLDLRQENLKRDVRMGVVTPIEESQRKIVIQRVKELSTGGFAFVPNGR